MKGTPAETLAAIKLIIRLHHLAGISGVCFYYGLAVYTETILIPAVAGVVFVGMVALKTSSWQKTYREHKKSIKEGNVKRN